MDKDQAILSSQDYKLHTQYEEMIKKQRRLYRDFASKEKSLSLLEKLVNYPDGLTPSELSNKLSVPKQTMTNLLTELEEKKMITRTIDKKDRRRIIVKLTPNGLKYEFNEHAPLRAAQMEAFNKLSDDEKKMLVELTMIYTEELKKQMSNLKMK